MPPLAFGICLVMCPASGGGGAPAADVELAPGVQVHFATADEGAAILGTRDEYIAAQSDLDRSLRLGAERNVPEAEYLAFVAQQALPWEEEQVAKLRPILAGVAAKLAPWKLRWPERIALVRTTGAEEAQAAYTRGSAIMLPSGKLEGDDEKLEALLLHELFHILSRANPELRNRLYEIVGFRWVGPLTWPDDLARRRLTNPDAPTIQHVVELEHEDFPEKIAAAPILIADPDRYDAQRGSNLFSYLQFKLLVVERREEGFAAAERDGQPILLDPADVPDFFEKIGRNTAYIIHPEEVLADNFVLLIRGRTDAPTPRILTEMHAVLMESEDR